MAADAPPQRPLILTRGTERASRLSAVGFLQRDAEPPVHGEPATLRHERPAACPLRREALVRREARGIEGGGRPSRRAVAAAIRTAHFPAVKTLEDFNLDHLPSLRRDVLAHLATSTFVAKAENVILLGPPGLGKMVCRN